MVASHALAPSLQSAHHPKGIPLLLYHWPFCSYEPGGSNAVFGVAVEARLSRAVSIVRVISIVALFAYVVARIVVGSDIAIDAIIAVVAVIIVAVASAHVSDAVRRQILDPEP